jgi:aryl-alcohol dehydrogenase-like predicted oxidoreductase
MQNQYSLTYREEEREMNKYCAFAGIGIIPYSPLAGGQLARSLAAQDTTTRSELVKKMPWYKPPAEYEDEIVRRVERLASDKGWKMSQVALTWIHGKVTSPIVGASSVSAVMERMAKSLLI